MNHNKSGAAERLQAVFLQTALKYDMFGSAKAVLCGYSGGSDSTALLYLMNDYCREHNIRFAAAHINHLIRGEEAERDEEHCRRVCEKLGVAFFCERIDIPEISRRDKIGTEEAARRERYAVFERLCKTHGFDRIALAHNSGDNFETVLFNMFRGASIKGLCGIPPVRGDIVRPLIECPKELISAYCDENGLKYVTDRTNSDQGYTRNFIRHSIIPLAKKVNARAEQNVARMCSLLRADSDLLDRTAAENAADGAFLERNIIRGYENFTGGGRLEAVHIKSAAALIREGKPHSSVSLPGGVAIKKTRQGFAFFNEKEKSEAVPSPRSKPLIEGVNDLGGAVIYVARGGSEQNCEDEAKNIKELKNIYKLFIHKSLYSDKISGSVYVRYRQNGDAVKQGGMTRSVKKLLCEKKIPPEERSGLPFICDDGGILWIPGVAARDGVCAPGEGFTMGSDDKTLELYYFYGAG